MVDVEEVERQPCVARHHSPLCASLSLAAGRRSLGARRFRSRPGTSRDAAARPSATA